MTPPELADLVEGSKAIHACLGGRKEILREEQPTIDFAYASVVAIQDIAPGEAIAESNVWVKRPGTGEILAKDFRSLLGRPATRAIAKNEQLKWSDVGEA
jgi:N-acetylneuraminate synthase